MKLGIGLLYSIGRKHKLLREFSMPTHGKILSTKYFNIHFTGCS
jgi:hypothetical protein